MLTPCIVNLTTPLFLERIVDEYPNNFEWAVRGDLPPPYFCKLGCNCGITE